MRTEYPYFTVRFIHDDVGDRSYHLYFQKLNYLTIEELRQWLDKYPGNLKIILESFILRLHDEN